MPIGEAARPANARQFLQLVFRLLATAADARVEENIDVNYPPDGVALEPEAYAVRRGDYLQFVTDRHEALFRTYACLADEGSRTLFLELILFRILGHEHVKLASNTPAFWLAKRAVTLLTAAPSSLAELSSSLNVLHFVIQLDHQTYAIDCLRANMLFSFFLRQYFFDRGGVVIAPRPGDHVIDAGACFGDTAIAFSHAVGPAGRVHSFDVVEAHLRLIQHNIGQNPGAANIVVHAVALGEADREGAIVTAGIDPGFSVTGPEGEVPIRSIDSLVAEGRIASVDFIKMDIEGHELSALRGARATLLAFRPRLAISLYHHAEDYYRIPEFIEQLGLGCRFYLDNYTISDGETVLYCDLSSTTKVPPA